MREDQPDVTAAVLAGGLGTRLHAVVSDRPKVLAEVWGRPFLAYLLDQLVSAGVRDAVLCTGYLGEQVRDTFGDAFDDLRLAYSHEPSPLGTGGALRLAEPLFKNNYVLVLNGDSYCDVNLEDFYTWHRARNAESTLLLTKMIDTTRYGRVSVDDDGVVHGFEEKDGRGNPGWINAGVYLFDRRRILDIPANQVVSLERDVFPGWVGRTLYGYRAEGRFLDIGTPESYALVEHFFSPLSLRSTPDGC